MYNCTYT